MSTVDISNLPSILKDSSGRKVILALEQRGPLTYTELLNSLDTAHTGKLNYHLKVLGDLIAKDESTSRYGLTQKGKLASQLLTQGFASNGYSRGGMGLFDIGRVLTIVGATLLLLAVLNLGIIGGLWPLVFPGTIIGIPCAVLLLAIGASVSAFQTKSKRLPISGIPLVIVGFIAVIAMANDLTYDIGPLQIWGSSIAASLGLILAITGLILVLSYRSRAAT